MKRWHWFDAMVNHHRFDVACEYYQGDLIIDEIRFARGEDDVTDILSGKAYDSIVDQVYAQAYDCGLLKRGVAA